MKWVFDWLREQIKTHLEQCIELRENSLDKFTEIGYGHRIDVYNRTLRYINEAEAKWEAECCEWKKNIYFFGGHDYSSGCGTRIPLNSLEYHKYCPFCGKPIKIAEVE